MWARLTPGIDYSRAARNVCDENTSFCHIIAQIVIRGNKDILPGGTRRAVYGPNERWSFNSVIWAVIWAFHLVKYAVKCLKLSLLTKKDYIIM